MSRTPPCLTRAVRSGGARHSPTPPFSCHPGCHPGPRGSSARPASLPVPSLHPFPAPGPHTPLSPLPPAPWSEPGEVWAEPAHSPSPAALRGAVTPHVAAEVCPRLTPSPPRGRQPSHLPRTLPWTRGELADAPRSSAFPPDPRLSSAAQ